MDYAIAVFIVLELLTLDSFKEKGGREGKEGKKGKE